MKKRENDFLENYKSLTENKNRLAAEHEKLVREAAAQKDKFVSDYYSIKESRELKNRQHGKLMESCRDNALGTAIKAIYISALEANSLTDNGLLLAESMVDTWIKERGGASKILTECQNDTYLLARLSQIVEETAINEVDEIEKIEKDEVEDDSNSAETETSAEDDSVDNSDAVALANKVIEKNAKRNPELAKAIDIILKKNGVDYSVGTGEDDGTSEPTADDNGSEEVKDDIEKPQFSDDKSEDDNDDPMASVGTEDDDEEEEKSESEEKEEDKEKDKESDDDKEEEKSESEGEESGEVEEDDDPMASVGTEDDDEGEESGDDTSDDTEVADDIIEDDETGEEPEEDDVTIDGDSENKGKIFDDLEKEDDVKKAVELIRQRVADAEETFIKKNAEDKKKVDELIGKISDNIKTVEDIADKENSESKVAEESARLYKQKLNQITESRPLTVLEKMTRNLSKSIVKNEVVREQYMTESGNMDTGLVVESAKVMYAFLETLNTLQLEKVDQKYITKILDEIK